VVDADGKVIGISDAYIPPQQGAVSIGFAIPAATAVNVADQLLESGRAEHALLGIQPAQMTPELARDFGANETSGVLVCAVTPDSPAAEAGIEPGDVLTSFAGRPLVNVEDVYAGLRRYRPGESVEIKLVRNATPQTGRMTLAAKVR
jgi:serine protease DegQ